MKTLMAVASLLVAIPAFAQEAPDALLKRVSAQVTQDPAMRSGDSAKLRAVIETKLLPHVDTRRVTQIAVGTTLLVRTYAGALSSYRDQTIEFLPLRSSATDTDVTVRSRIRQSGAETVMVEYDLAKGEAGWKVYDVRVAGISLVATYRSTFADEVRNRGIDGLIATLAAKNRS